MYTYNPINFAFNPVPFETGIVSPSKKTPTVFVFIWEFSFIYGIFLNQLHSSVPIQVIILKLPLHYHRSHFLIIFMHDSPAICLIVFPSADILIAVCKDKFSLAICFTLKPLPLIICTITPLHSPNTITESSEPLPRIYRSCFVSIRRSTFFSLMVIVKHFVRYCFHCFYFQEIFWSSFLLYRSPY